MNAKILAVNRHVVKAIKGLVSKHKKTENSEKSQKRHRNVIAASLQENPSTPQSNPHKGSEPNNATSVEIRHRPKFHRDRISRNTMLAGNAEETFQSKKE